MGGGVFGVEADVGYSPRFFGTDINIGNVPISLAHNNVLTGMFNADARHTNSESWRCGDPAIARRGGRGP